MHFANYYYGHGNILAIYCGQNSESPPPMRGLLQHGITGSPKKEFWAKPPMANFVWSIAAHQAAQAAGVSNTIPIGSPWAYLLSMVPRERITSNIREGTIFYPFHGWEKEGVVGDHQQLVEEVVASEGGLRTVCLYWLEYENPAIRAVYERVGARVICNGYRGGDGVRPATVDFLVRQLEELLMHERVVSNRLSTVIRYGASVGCEVAVYGNPMVLNSFAGPLGMGEYQSVRDRFPVFHGFHTDRAETARIAREELGLDLVLHPAVLAAVLGWH